MDANPCSTTFVQADTASFKQVVQLLTGYAETKAQHAASGEAPPKNPPPPSPKVPIGPKKPAFKLYERRGSLKHLKMLSDSPTGSKQPIREVLSQCVLDFPSLALSPVTPLIPDPFDRPPHQGSATAVSAEDRAIAEKRFYLHPSPRVAEQPRLLPLFPVISQRSSSSA